MKIVELKLDETLADFEVQNWIDNVFNKKFPDIEAKIKKGCNGTCGSGNKIKELEEEIEELKKICDFNCPDHKFATHNACLFCPAVRNSPHHDLRNVSDEELQKIIKDAETEMM